MMPAVRAMPVSAAALEASTAAIPAPVWATVWTAIRATIATAMRTIRTPIRASSAAPETSAITATVASTALWALETRTWICADAREVFTRSVRITRAAGFPRQKNGVIFNDGFDGGTIGRRCGRHGFRRNVLDGLVVSKVGALGFGHLRAVFLFVTSLARFGLSFRVAGFRGELCFARFIFRVFAVFTLFLFCFGFFFVVSVFLMLRNFMRFVEGFRFILIKIRATDKRVGFRASLRLFVLGFHQAGGERDSLFIAKASGAIANRPGRGLLCVLLRGGCHGFLSGLRGVLLRGGFPCRRVGFRFRIG